MLPSQGTQFFGQSEGQHKILGWHLFVELSFQPLLAFIVLAMRTIAMSTGMRDEDLFFAAVTLYQHYRALSGATLFQRRQGFKLAGQRGLISRQKLGFKALDDRRKPYHLTPRQSMAKPLISALIKASAC
jgi:hypothetical protein